MRNLKVEKQSSTEIDMANVLVFGNSSPPHSIYWYTGDKLNYKRVEKVGSVPAGSFRPQFVSPVNLELLEIELLNELLAKL